MATQPGASAANIRTSQEAMQEAQANVSRLARVTVTGGRPLEISCQVATVAWESWTCPTTFEYKYACTYALNFFLQGRPNTRSRSWQAGRILLPTMSVHILDRSVSGGK